VDPGNGGVTCWLFEGGDVLARSLDLFPLAAAREFAFAFSARSFLRLSDGESISMMSSSSPKTFARALEISSLPAPLLLSLREALFVAIAV
jgi:hypothetical protein